MFGVDSLIRILEAVRCKLASEVREDNSFGELDRNERFEIE